WGAGFLGFRGGHYRGSDQTRDWFLPLPYFTYTSEYIEAEPSFVRGTFFKNDWLSLKLSVLAGLNVESETNRARRGMPSLDYTFEAGPMAIFNLWKSSDKLYSLTFEIPFRMVHTTDLSYVRAIGFFGIPYLNLRSAPLKTLMNWSFEVSIAGMWGSKKYHNHFYGVAPLYATAGRPTYNARDGFSGTQYTIILNKRYKDFVFVPFFRFDDLHGTAFEESPLVKKKRYTIGGLAFFWLFGDDLKELWSKK
ncbi:MAG: MipA/OmpV family protein, partial [Halobacteriovoraceae bacterium]|nr:MipA/OmpV family protein [Halobacteriovoraceae bacterium]